MRVKGNASFCGMRAWEYCDSVIGQLRRLFCGSERDEKRRRRAEFEPAPARALAFGQSLCGVTRPGAALLGARALAFGQSFCRG